MTDQAHYVCVECEGVGENPGVCSTEDCDMEGESLKECHCDDGSHMEAMGDDMGDDYEDEDFDDEDDDDYDDDYDDDDDDDDFDDFDDEDY